MRALKTTRLDTQYATMLTAAALLDPSSATDEVTMSPDLQVIGRLLGRSLVPDGSLTVEFDAGKPHTLFRDTASGQRGVVKTDSTGSYDASLARFLHAVSATDVSMAVWVCNQWSPKHLQLLAWLDAVIRDVSFHGVAWSSEGSAAALVGSPHTKTIAPGSANRPTKEDRRQFFESLRARLARSMPETSFRIRDEKSRPWLIADFETPRTGLYVDPFRTRGPMHFGYWAVGRSATDLFNHLRQDEAQIAQELGGAPTWLNPSFDGRGINIVCPFPTGTDSAADRASLAETIESKLLRFDRALRKRTESFAGTQR